LNRKPEEEEIYTEEYIRTNFLAKYPGLRIILKLGSRGAAYIDKDMYVMVPSVTKLYPEILEEYKIVDTTGAGDCFVAAFFEYFNRPECGLLTKKSWLKLSDDIIQRCLYFANFAAFLCITKKGMKIYASIGNAIVGAMPAMPTFDAVMAAMKKYSSQF
jgi:ribokinase